jgi:hypothetical protein
MSQNILFFSQNCQHSKKLIAKIINTPLYGSLQKVCVDDPQTRSKLPKWVNCVPMIYLAQNNTSFQNPLKDPEIWMWIESQISQTQVKAQPPQQQFQQQQQNMNQNPSPSSSQPPQPPVGGESMGFEPFNSMEMRGGIASDNYSLFSNDNPNTVFQHSYEMIGANAPPPPPSSQYKPPSSQSGGMAQGMNQSDSRSSQKQEKFEQELAMKKAIRDQDSTAPQGRKMDGVPQNFNQMWEQQSTRP